MLDTDTKRRIDTARDILVGKVPDPKSQVEQITIALIYKFMDDMDAEAEEFGGHRKFFTGDFARYGWAKLMYPGLGGHEMLGLYAEGITKMPENPGIPLLFRDIFKNAYLPYRDPETLKGFLKVINEFSYDHSERLGDAFEYLLSVLGSQGDAGQFRTPRHIIDFMVSIVDPKKGETILDPACGTAGFLISAYKHILRANTDETGKVRLTPDERGRLAENIKGYDISPDMVRLSLVNLYLHGFPDPHISEYDTLTQEERWNELADVILANPPFMSPKGGIKPHKRFSIDAKRSEVLFVDYMAEHLTANGRAGIIVPEGIIFQSQGAYKELRKMLVENSLVAVISLPAGCFNPYSGVKTSILILDKSLGKQSTTIGFFKIENDGFGLGAQRRAMDGSDLPQVRAEIGAYIHALRSHQLFSDLRLSHGLIVPKEKISADGDFNLSGERYREGIVTTSFWPFVSIKDVAAVESGYGFPLEHQGTTIDEIPFLKVSDMNIPGNEREVVSWNNTVSRDVLHKLKARAFPKGTVIFPKIGAAIATNKKRILTCESAYDNNVMGIVPDSARLLSDYLFAYLSTFDISKWASESQPPSIRKTIVEDYQIPLPPIEVQKEIVAEIEGYQKVIDGARAVLDNYRPHIPIHPDWPLVPLRDIFSTKSGTTPSRGQVEYFKNGTIPWVKTLDLTDGPIRSTDEMITPKALKETSLSILPKGTVLIAMYGGFNQIGRTGVLEIEAAQNQAMTALLPTPEVSPYFLNTVLVASKEYWKRVANSTRKDPNITKSDVLDFKLPLPPLAMQQSIVAEIEAEQALVAGNRELIARFERKIQTTLARVWGEEKP
ncbi:MAG: N-6 DNA methylase [Terracidiphilus sp.]